MKKRRIVGIVAFLVMCGVLLGVAQCLLCPHDPQENPEAMLMQEFTEGFGEQDVLFLGDCEIYEGISSVTLWEEYGIDCWIAGSPQQLLWHSYAALAQAFEVGSPSVVVLGVYALRYGEPQNEAYNRMVLDGLKKTPSILPVLRDSMTQGESLLSYYIPLLRYHDRWSSLSWRDVTLLLEESEPVSYQGYRMRCGVLPDEDGVIDHEDAMPLLRPDFGEMALEYFDRIVSLCRENGAQLILLKAPTDSWAYPWYEEWEAQVCELAQAYDLPYYNLLKSADEIGLDYTRDTYDGGFHLNVSGAEKVASYLGEILKNEYGVPDRTGDVVRAARWEGVIQRYEQQKNP